MLLFPILDLSLFDMLQNSNFTGFPIEDIQKYTKNITKGLENTDKKNLIHCDLKPENIMYDN